MVFLLLYEIAVASRIVMISLTLDDLVLNLQD